MIGWTVKRGEQVGLARDPAQAAHGEHERVAEAEADRGHRAAPSGSRTSCSPVPSSRSSGSGGFPVRVMKTSSRVGRRTATSSILTPASSSSRTACVIEVPPLIGTLTIAVLGDRRPVGGDRSQRRNRRVDRGAGAERHLELLAADAVLELVRGALGDHQAVVDDRDLVGEAIRLVEVLGREQDRGPAADAILDHLPEGEPAAWIEAGGRLVEEDHRRAGDERRGEVEPAAHAAGVGLDQPIGGLGEVEALEQLERALLRLGAREVVEAPDHGQVLLAGQVLVDRRVLAREADLGAELRRRRRRRRSRRRGPSRHPAAAAWSGSGPRSSSRRRSGRAGRAPCRPRRAGRRRRARRRRRTSCGGLRPRSGRNRP